MTDKEQIIVDGVDVKQCNYLCTDGTCACAFTDLICTPKEKIENNCIDNPNCYFKQLQKEKFENLNNRQMVESAENLIYENSELIKNLKEKEQECEELKAQLNEYERAGGILDEGEAWYHIAQKYKQALEEIEIYCNVIKQTTCDFKDCNNKNDVEFIKMLLDIIKKAKDGNNE